MNNNLLKSSYVYLFILSILFILLYLNLVSTSQNEWVIDKNSVYVNDTKIYVSATPHTISYSQYVYFNLTSKVYEGNADIVFGFDTNSVKPIKAELYQPVWKNNLTDASDLTKKGDIAHFNITLEDNIGGGNWTFSFFNGTAWQNNSGNWTGVNYSILNETRIITAIKNQQVKWKWYFSDLAGNANETPIWWITVANTPPNQTQPSLKTPSGKNLSTENLTCYNQSTSDADNDNVTNIYNWYKNSLPLLSLNMPFEINVNDYSGNNNHGTISGTTFESGKTSGKVGNALQFDGVDDYVNAGTGTSLNISQAITIEAWIKPSSATSYGYFITKDDTSLNRLYDFKFETNKIRSLFWDSNGALHNLYSDNTLNLNQWYHVVTTYNGSVQKNYINGNQEPSTLSWTGTIKTNANIPLRIGGTGTWLFNGSIDEVRIYPYALTAEQIKQRYEETKDGLTSSSKIVSQETSGGDNWMCQITPNDAEADGETLNSTSLGVLWAIEFDVRDSYSNASLDGVIINCNYTAFNQLGDTTNIYGPYGLPPGNWQCSFTKTGYFDKTTIFNADADKIIDMKMSESGKMSPEEHTWLEAIYNCIILGDCSLYNLLVEINQTVGNIWEHTKPTDESVITNETIINRVVNATNNLTINYTVNIPIKAGYGTGDYLPVRIGFWFLDVNNVTCYNQGSKPTGVEDPYCQPLVIETIGPMGGSVSFIVKLHPSLPAGSYSIKRMIDIDPNSVWINYGQETIGMITLVEPLNNPGISLEKTGEVMPSAPSGPSNNVGGSGGGGSGSSSVTNTYNIYNVTNVIKEKEERREIEENKTQGIRKAGITGGVIGARLLSERGIIIIIAILCGTFIIFVIVRYKPIIKIKKK